MPIPRFSNKCALWIAVALLLGAAAILAACKTSETSTPCPECPPTDCPEAECPETVASPFAELWASSGHADAAAEAFTHWNEEDPAQIPVSCAKCHSTPGYLDFLGADGTAAGVVDSAAITGTVVTCVACHNEATLALTSVTFPSEVEVTGLGDEARCIVCHQGRTSAATVDNAVTEAGLADDDTASEELGFVNIHYFAAGATQFGGVTMGGYQYADQSYDAKFAHVAGIDSCIDCHDQHTLEVKVETCSECHTRVANTEDLKDVRMQGSGVDYDGDGDVTEGIYYEIEGLQGILYQAIQAYASEAGAPIVYDAQAHPYFYNDTNANGETDGDEATYNNGYNAWTGRLLKAAYNYQVSVKDPGAFAHGGKYIIQLLYDSIGDLDADLLVGLHRIDAGHFAGSEEAFRHWDEGGEVEADCARCHSAIGLPTLLKDGANVSEPLANGFLCSTCHDSLTEFTRYEVAQVKFPSGAVVASEDPNTNLCMTCHQGRESTVSLDRALAGFDDDTVYEELGGRSVPKDVHYFAAGATRYGTEVQGAYEYEGKAYNGRFAHVESYAECTQCHDAHTLELEFEACSTCHAGVESPQDIRRSTIDFDGDGDVGEGLAGELDTMRDALYAAMQDYAANVVGTPIVYADRYPYFFADTNVNGEVDEDEANYGKLWTPRLLRAAYNYQYSVKDPGAFAHNGRYILQVLYDSVRDLGGDTTGMSRPQPESE